MKSLKWEAMNVDDLPNVSEWVDLRVNIEWQAIVVRSSVDGTYKLIFQHETDDVVLGCYATIAKAKAAGKKAIGDRITAMLRAVK